MERPEVWQPDLGHHADQRSESGWPAALELLDLDLGPVDGVDLAIAQGLIHHWRDQRVYDLVADGRRSQPGFDEGPGRLAGPKALDANALGEPVENSLIGSVDLISRYLDGQTHLAAWQRLGNY